MKNAAVGLAEARKQENKKTSAPNLPKSLWSWSANTRRKGKDPHWWRNQPGLHDRNEIDIFLEFFCLHLLPKRLGPGAWRYALL